VRQAVLHGVKDRPTNERAMLLQLTTFVRIADAGNISRAARSLGLSVPMASRHLRWLEEELGVPLMRRTTHRLDLTEAGTELVARARVILASVEEAREIVRPGPGVAGHVVVSAPVSFGVHRLSPLLPSLFEKHPRLRVEIRLEDHVVDLLADGVDVAIRALSGPRADSSSLVTRRLATYARLLCASPQLVAARGPIESVAALAHVPCVVHRGASSWTFETQNGAESVTVDGALRTNNFLVARDAVLAGLGVGWLPEYVVAEDLRKRRLVRVLPGAELSAIELFGVFHRQTRGVAAIRAVLDHVARALRRGSARSQRDRSSNAATLPPSDEEPWPRDQESRGTRVPRKPASEAGSPSGLPSWARGAPEPLDGAPPPLIVKPFFGKVASCVPANELSPEGSRRHVLGALTHLPRPFVCCEDLVGRRRPQARATVSPEHEELRHVPYVIGVREPALAVDEREPGQMTRSSK